MAKVDSTCSIEACAAHYGDDAEAVKTYMIEGKERALTLDRPYPV